MTAPEEIQQEIEQTRERLALVAAGILVIGAGLVRRRRET
jgi:hypothetical protein